MLSRGRLRSRAFDSRRLLRICTAVRAARTRSSKPASRVRLPGGTPNGVLGPVMPHGAARISTSFTRVAKLETQTPVDRLTAGSNPAPGALSTLVRCASGKRGGCLPPKASSILVRTAHDTPGYPNQIEDAGSDPVSCRCKSCPWYRRARSTTAVQPPDERPTRGSTPPARTRRTSRTHSVTP